MVITFRDSQAIALMNACKECGYSIPDDTELVCILNSKYLTMMRPTISTYNIPEYDLGAVAMRLLTKMLVEDESVKQNKDIEIFKIIEIRVRFELFFILRFWFRDRTKSL